MDIEIRESVFEDARAVAAVHLASWKDGYKGIIHQSHLDDLKLELFIERWDQNLRKGKTDQYKHFVALDKDEIVGFVDVGMPRRSDMAGYGELYAIYLAPAYFERAKQQALLFGYKSLYVWVLEHNVRGQGFYKSMGAVVAPGIYDDFLIGGRPYRDMQYRWADL